MDTLDKIYDMMYCELDDIAKKEKLDSKDVELIDKFIDIIKDIDEITMAQDNNTSYMRGRSGRMMPMYGHDWSYGRKGNEEYSRNNNKEAMLSHLQQVADMAIDEKDRRAVNRLMQQMIGQE